MKTEMDLGTFVSLNLIGDESYYIPASYWDEVDAALHQYTERAIDKVLSFTTLAGADVLLPVSRVSDASISTPDAREKNRAIARVVKAEQGYADD